MKVCEQVSAFARAYICVCVDCIHTCICYTHVCSCTHFPVLFTGSAGPGMPRSRSTPSTQILVSKYHLLLQVTRAPWRDGQFQPGQEKYQMLLEHRDTADGQGAIQEPGRCQCLGSQLDGAHGEPQITPCWKKIVIHECIGKQTSASLRKHEMFTVFKCLPTKYFLINRKSVTLQGRGLADTILIKQSTLTWPVMGLIKNLPPTPCFPAPLGTYGETRPRFLLFLPN